MIDVKRLWVQNETGELMDGSTVDLADEPVTHLPDVISEWKRKFVRREPGEPPMHGNGNEEVVEYWRGRALQAEAKNA